MSEEGKRPHLFKRKLLIAPRFQLELIAYFSGATAIALLCLYWSLNRLFENFLDQVPTSTLGAGSALYDALTRQHAEMVKLFFIFGFILEAFVIFGGLVLSNRIAGPLYRVIKALRSPEATTELHFRKNDYYSELADAINDVIKAKK